LYGNRRKKPTEIVLRSEGGRMMVGNEPRHIVSINGNVTMTP
jgi:hypothetical protein